MSDTQLTLTSFRDLVVEEEQLWALQTPEQDWVICESDQPEMDVFPLFSSQQKAEAFCTDEWQDYQAVAIDLEQFLEEIVVDLAEQSILCGVDWELDQEAIEMNAIDFAKALVDA
ncbi:DUF2750 domain-containing protein [Thalassotalea aquiviva]|uniref:DUF2750 domain-containing protein n=1 Tax=Thalassotalea aquiviva TaxID=3242415 RepID=UPI00352A2BEE